MTFLRSTAASITLAAAVVAPVVATPSYQEGTIDGYYAEILESGSYSEPDYIEVFGPRGKEQILVTCAPFDWRSSGPNTSEFVNQIAQSWCF